MSDSVRPHRRQSTRLPHPWDSPGKNTGVGCHFLLQCMKVKSEREVAQSCSTLCDRVDYRTPGLPAHRQIPEFTQTHVHWVGDTIQPSHPVISFSCCPQSFPASRSFQMSQFFSLGVQSIGVSVSASVLPMNIQDWFPLEWTGWISLQAKGVSRVFSNTTAQTISSSVLSFLYSPTLTSIHDYWKNHSFV